MAAKLSVMQVPNLFICPECGGFEAAEHIVVEATPMLHDPWAGVLRIIRCERCRCLIPAHLGELWDDLTVQAAREEWRKIFKLTQPKELLG